MGIPAAFRWLSTKYPKTHLPVAEEQPIVMEDGNTVPVDTFGQILMARSSTISTLI